MPNKFRIFHIAFVMLCLSVNFVNGQSDWSKDMFNPKVNFYQTQEKFNTYWEGNDIPKGKGWKQFKRWEAFMEPRVESDGSFPSNALYKQYQKHKNQPRSSSSPQANWMPYGPTLVPLQSSGTKRGIGRLNIVEFDPQNPDVLWVGAPAGGLWKSIDAGLNWSSNTDLLPNLGVSDIAIDPTNSNIMFIATGDRDAGDTYSYGVMKSIDGGNSWDSTGLSFYYTQSYRGNRVLINPNNTNQILVSVRRASGTGEVYRSTDGGDNFNLQLQKNLVSMEFKPDDPNVVYGGSQIGGPSGIFKSTDNGQSWTQLTNGLPTSGVERCHIAVTPANPSVVYALFCGSDEGFYGIYKSVDEGASWTVQADSSNAPNLLGWSTDGTDSGGQGWYDLALTVSPTDENLLIVGGVNSWKSTDGGQNWNISSHWYGGGGTEYKHADVHYLRYNSANNRLYSANDGGLYFSDNDGLNWTDISDGLQITQFYRSGLSQTDPELIIAGAQDNGTFLMDGINSWTSVRGGDGMECAIDPNNPDVMYSTVYYGALSKSTNGGGNFNDIAPANDGAWVTPFVLDPSNSNRIIAGYTEVWESLDGGDNWSTLTNGQAGGEIDAIAVSKSDGNVIYFSEYNELYLTTDNGANWSLISNGLPNRSISYISIDPLNPEKAWISYSGYGNGQKVYQTNDFGSNWTNISAGLPNLPANCVIINHNNPLLEELYVGTDLGVFYRDSSMTLWETFNQGMPNVIVNELEIQYQSSLLIATTYGRGIWKTDLPISEEPTASFNASDSLFCNLPAQVNFSNTSINATNHQWDFGDGNTSNDFNPSHTYTTFGDFTIQLIATGPLGTDTLIKTNHISVLPSNPCEYLMPPNGVSNTFNTCSGILFDSGGEQGNYPDNTDSYVTISPIGANQLTIDFTEFGIEAPTSATNCNFDYIEIFDGPDTNATSLGQFCNTLTGSPGLITSSGGSLTIHLHSDGGTTDIGFKAFWNCVYPNQSPDANVSTSYLNECTGNVQFVDQSIYNPTSWEWNFGDGNSSFDPNPNHTYLLDGSYDVQLIASNSYGSDTIVYNDFVNVSIVNPPTTTNDTICSGQQAQLFADGMNNNNLSWYANNSGGTAFHTGNSYTTSPLSNTITYYVEELVTNATFTGGPVDNNTLGSGGYHYNDSWDMVFDCFDATLLKSIDLYAETNFTTTIEILDNSGAQVHDAVVSFTTGLNTIELNFLIQPGLDYQIGINGTNDGLYRNDVVPSGSFPFSIGNSIQITANTTNSPQSYFYYFYNWQLEEVCASNRTPVTAHVNAVTPQSGNISLISTNLSICENDTFSLSLNSGMNNYLWFNGDVNSSISLSEAVAGQYSYWAEIVDQNGCINSDTISVIIQSCPTNINSLLTTPVNIFPNPTSGTFIVSHKSSKEEISNISVFNLQGKLIMDKQTKYEQQILQEEFNLSDLSKGVYLIQIRTDQGSINKKIILQ